MESYQQEGGKGRMREKVQGIIHKNGRYKMDRGKVNSSIGNGEAKELTSTTHGHELRGECWWVDTGQRGIEGRKNRTTIIA